MKIRLVIVLFIVLIEPIYAQSVFSSGSFSGKYIESIIGECMIKDNTFEENGFIPISLLTNSPVEANTKYTSKDIYKLICIRKNRKETIFIIKFNNPIIKNELAIKIFNSQGLLILSKEISNNITSIDCTGFCKGIYLICFYSNQTKLKTNKFTL